MRQTYVGSSQREGSVRPLPHREITRSQVLVKESVERGSRSGGKSRIASVLPRLIQELVLLGQMAFQQDDADTACSLLEASATLAKQMREGQDCTEPFSLLAWVADLPRNGPGVSVLPWERPMDTREGSGREAITSSLVEVDRGVAYPGWARMSALPIRKLQSVPTPKPSVGSSTELTTREVEVLRLVADGLTDTQVAEQLVISPRTVNWHLSVIYSKLGVSSRVAATRFALVHELV
jgi:DNA-binding CsgD family transcriptional regulator